MSEPTLETKTANINNQRLFKEIDEFMIEVFTALSHIAWHNKQHRTEFIEMIDMWMEQYAHETGKIIQYNILCDSRNNTPTAFKKGPVNFTLRYRQKNCLNTTEITYTISF